MKKVYVVTKVRGFLTELLKKNFENIDIKYTDKNTYELNTKRKELFARIVRSWVGSILAPISSIKLKSSDYRNFDLLFSYNRLLDCQKPYIIYLENPFALVHYSNKRPYNMFIKKKLKKLFYNDNLKTIVCLSESCYDTLKLVYDIPDSVKVKQIYPYISDVTLEKFKCILSEKGKRTSIQCLFVTSNFILKGGNEILCAFNLLSSLVSNNIKLKIVTPISKLDEENKNKIEKNNNIELVDFNLTKAQLNEVYADNDILLNPTRQDSFSLVTLEAMKYGNVILSTDLYAIPEMVHDQENGFIFPPKYRFFDYNKLPNDYVWNHRKKTIQSDFLDEAVVEFLKEKLVYLFENREKMINMSKKSFEIANNGSFSSKKIANEWQMVLQDS